MTEQHPKLGIIAGGGSAPRRLIEVCRLQNRPFFVFALDGQTDPETLADDVPYMRLPFGAASRLREKTLEENVQEFIMIGNVRRPSLSEIRPDWLALKSLARIGFNLLGDDGLLRAIAGEFEREGYRVVGIQDIYRDLLMPQGQIGAHKPDEQALTDIKRASVIAKTLGQCDVGQAAVVQQGIVLGLEAVEGTKALLERALQLRREGPGGVLVKWCKPSQDSRFDLPAIGPETIEQAAQAGLRGIAGLAGKTLLIDPEICRALADQNGLFLIGLESVTANDGN